MSEGNPMLVAELGWAVEKGAKWVAPKTNDNIYPHCHQRFIQALATANLSASRTT